MISRRSAPIVGVTWKNIALQSRKPPSAWVFAPHATRAQSKPSSSATSCRPKASSRITPLAQRRPAKRALFETLGRQNQSPCRPRTTTSPAVGPLGSRKYIDHAAERVRAQRLVNHRREPVHRPCGNRPASSRSGPSRPRRGTIMPLPSARERSSRQRRAVGGQRNARDHRADCDEDFQDPLRPAQPSSAGTSSITRRKAGRVRTSPSRGSSRGPSPSKQLLRGDPVTPRDLGHHRPHRQCLLEIRAFSSDDHRRRRPVPVNTSTRRATLWLRAQAYGQTYSRADPKSEIRICQLTPGRGRRGQNSAYEQGGASCVYSG